MGFSGHFGQFTQTPAKTFPRSTSKIEFSSHSVTMGWCQSLIPRHENTRLFHLYNVTVSVVIESFNVLDVAKVKDLYDLKRNNSVFDLNRSMSLFVVTMIVTGNRK